MLTGLALVVSATAGTPPPSITTFEIAPANVAGGDPEATFAASISGTVELRLEGGPGCADGAVLTSEPYVFPLVKTIAIANSDLAEGVNSIRACFDATGGGSATETALVGKYSTPPQTSLDATPPARARSSSAGFSFSSTQPGGTFECRLDGASFAPCATGIVYPGLSDDTHVFVVRAINPAGLPDLTPEAWIWTIDTVAPETGLVAAPAGTLAQRDVTIEPTASEPGASFECKLNGGPYEPCGSPKTYVGLADGAYTVLVRAVDAAGNVDPTPISAAFTVDAPPETVIVAGPVGAIATARATFVFGGTSAGDTFECSLDGGPYTPCASPHSVGGLGAGAHTLEVRAVDAGGERDPTPARSGWSVVPVAESPAMFAANVRKARVKPGDHRAVLTWRRPRDADYDHVEIVRIPGKKKQARSLVYKGKKVKFVDRGLKNGVEYTWILYAADRKGNRSGGVTRKATAPVRIRLGRRVVVAPNTPVVLQWKGRKRARFYNVQLFRGKTKVLSSWPGRATVSLVGPWNWEGRKRRLVAGKYEWFVWPGFGKRADSNFGKLIGSGKLIVRRR